MACLIDKQRQWKFRLKNEIINSDIGFWLTLQYDNEHLRMINDSIPVVHKLDCQNYFRQLRKSIKSRELPVIFRYFLVSEYCPTTKRPHYHCLMLFRFTEKVSNPVGIRTIIYDLIRHHWYHGFVYEKLFHSGVIGYLTKYVFKTSEEDYPVSNFRLISNGIGADYLKQIDQRFIYQSGWRTPDGILPRYYRDKICPTPGSRIYMTKNEAERLEKRSLANERLFDRLYHGFFREASKFKSLNEFMNYQNYLNMSQKSQAERRFKRRKDF